jgi:DNA-directed RNA polymerase subunit RPC12/RpoP
MYRSMSTTIESGERTNDDGSVRCPDCGWSGPRSDLEMTKTALLQCPQCHERS